MRVLTTFLFLSTALAQRDSAASAAVDAPDAAGAAAVSANAVPTVAEAAGPVAAAASEADSTRDRPGAYVPLFDFDLAPYNVALEIVASALEKLADTMEPLDVPLPLVGPGYYLEVQVKSPKNPHGRPPPGELNPVSIEGGQAQPVTEIDIILPGESAAHQTILIPAQGQSTQGMAPSLGESSSADSRHSALAAASALSPASSGGSPWDEDDDDDGSSSVAATVPSTALVPPTIAGTESARAPLTDVASHPAATGLSHSSSAAASPSSAATSPLAPMGGMVMQQPPSRPSATGEPLSLRTSASGESVEAPQFTTPGWGSLSSSDAALPRATGSTQAATEPRSKSVALDMSMEMSAESSSGGGSSSSSGSSDLWAGLFPQLSSSAPSSAPGSAPGSPSGVSSTAGVELSHASPEVSASGDDEAPTESEPMASESDDDDVTTASELLPFPPLGNPRTQQRSDASSAQPASASSSHAGSSGAIATVDILDASDENALESSIDAVIHSVIQDYHAQSTPKAAVGFALFHPRSIAAPEWS
ncbi:hypothetical protein IWQ57_001515 [Coemansia nantahalensis]|uniref:Uncharacterized protein n=1 Tax=Coemansia nantahalensis TaxID=2789366 RepID=A0ACC1K4R2_9FUNG|nr:hypothetical protein IWQ57_001515 [Coemansia nantahalensis]